MGQHPQKHKPRRVESKLEAGFNTADKTDSSEKFREGKSAIRVMLPDLSNGSYPEPNFGGGERIVTN